MRWTFGLLLAVACIEAPSLEGRPCAADGACPLGLVCGTDRLCWRDAPSRDAGRLDAGTPHSAARDAGPDDVLVALDVAPSAITLVAGRTAPITALATYAVRGEIDVSDVVEWRVRDGAVAAMEGATLRGLREGASIVEAELDGLLASCAVAVLPPVVDDATTFNKHNVVLWSDGVVTGWGGNSHGQLGGNDSHVTTPRALPLTDAVAIYAGGATTFVKLRDGTVWGIGRDTTGGRDAVPRPVLRDDDAPLRDVVDLQCGMDFCLALSPDGRVDAWGNDSFGALGQGGAQATLPAPTRVPGLGNVRAIAVGAYHAVALHLNGEVSAWGYNEYGQLGDDSDAHRASPVAVRGVGGDARLNGVVEIRAGWGHSVARLASGSVVTWGWNAFGQLGDDTFDDRDFPDYLLGEDGAAPLINVSAIAAGFSTSLAATSGGELLAWGWNGHGQLGDGSDVMHRPLPGPVLASAAGRRWTSFTAFVAGADHVLLRTADGAIYTFGTNVDAEQAVGFVGEAGDHGVPTPVIDLGR